MTETKPHILVVENEPLVAIELRLNLEKLGYDVVGIAATSEQVLRLAAEIRPDLALMNIDICGAGDVSVSVARDATEIAAALGRDWDVPVVYFASASDDETLRRANASTPSGFLTRPFRACELRATLEMALSKADTERRLRLIEAQLLASAEKFSATLGVIDNAVIVADAGGCVSYLNTQAQQLTGLSSEAALGRPLDEIAPLHFPQTPELRVEMAPGETAPQGVLNAFLELQSCAGEATMEAELRTRRGEMRSVEVRVTPLGDGLAGVVLALRDISERKRVEAQLYFQKSLLETPTENFLDGVLVVSEVGEILSFNQRFLQMWRIDHPCGVGEDHKLLLQEVIRRVAHPEQFLERVRFLYEQRTQRSHDEISLRDGRIFDRYSAPITTSDGIYQGRVWYFCDITERRHAEEALRQSEERGSAVIRNALDCIIIIDHESRIVEFNPAAEATFGFAKSEAVGRTLDDLIVPPEFREAHRKGMAHFLQSGEGPILNRRVEVPALCKDGTEITVELAATVVAGTQPPLFIAYLRDITQSKRAKDALAQSEQRFQNIVSNVPGMVYQFVMQADGRIEWPFVGEGCREIFEVEPTSMRDNPSLVLDTVHPDDRDDFYDSITESQATLSPWFWEGRHRLPSGKIGWIQGASRPERLPGGGTLWNGVVVDITARKEAEAERDRFFTLALDMLGIAGEDGYFKRLNPAFSQTLGFSEAELLARPCLDYVHPDDRAATAAAWQKLQSGKPITGFENRFGCKDGSYRWLEWKATWEDGLIYAAAREITLQKNSEASLRQMRDELELRVGERTAELATSNAALQVQIREREEAEAEIRARARQQEAVAELGRLALTGIDIDTLLRGATALACATLDVEISTILEVLPGAGGAFQIRAANGWSRDLTGQRVPGGKSSKAGYVLISKAPVIVTDLASETRFIPPALLLEEGIRSGVTVMLGARNQPFGTLGAHSKKSRVFTQDDVHFLQAMSNVLAAALEGRRVESEIRELNGELKSTNLQLKVENAERLMALGALREATQVLESAKEEAELATAAANAANLAKSEFLSRMSHELRTPLNAILGFGQILEMRASDSAFGGSAPIAGKAADLRQLGNIEQILKAGRHLLSLINEVLDITSIETGHLSLSPEPVSIGTMAGEGLDLVRPLAAQRRITLHNQVVGEIGHRHMLADQQRFKQVLLNLLSNAVKYGREGGHVWVGCEVFPTPPQDRGALEFGCKSRLETRDRLRFWVRDDGAGLSQCDIAKLFVPFERL